MKEFNTTTISSEVAKISKHRLSRPKNPSAIPTHPISARTISRMKYYGIHWTLNAFIKRLKRSYIDLIANIPRYAKVKILPRTTAGQPLLPPGLTNRSDTSLEQCVNALRHFYNDTYQTFSHAVTHSDCPWEAAKHLQKDLWSNWPLRSFTQTFWEIHNHRRKRYSFPEVAPSTGNMDTPSLTGLVAKPTRARYKTDTPIGKQCRTPAAEPRTGPLDKKRTEPTTESYLTAKSVSPRTLQPHFSHWDTRRHTTRIRPARQAEAA